MPIKQVQTHLFHEGAPRDAVVVAVFKGETAGLVRVAAMEAPTTIAAMTWTICPRFLQSRLHHHRNSCLLIS